MSDKYGFVYIWYDSGKSKSHRDELKFRYYIGCHWGSIDDGYICSSKWMKSSYKRRPQDFKRRILKTDINNKKLLLDEEYIRLSKIKDNELGEKYYNIHNHHFKHWSSNPEEAERIRELAKNRIVSEETRFKISEAKKGKMVGEKNPMYGKPGTRGHLGHIHSDEIREKISKKVQESYDSGKEPWNKGLTGFKGWNKGISHTEEHKANLRKPKSKIECPHCHKIGGSNIMKRYHFNNCKEFINNRENNKKKGI